MKTIEIKVYQFSELSDDAKQKAIEECSNYNVDYEWWDYTYEDAKTIGLKITEFDLDRNRHCNGEFNLSASEVAQNIFNEHGESCETYKTAKKFMAEWQPIFADYMDEFHEYYESPESEEQMEAIEDEFLQSILEDYSIMLQKEYEYLTSDEAIIETIEANEYEFLETGKRY